MGQRVLLIEKASRDQVEPANVRVRRVHPQDQNIAFLPSPDVKNWCRLSTGDAA